MGYLQIFLMGVSGSGKSTIGKMLSEKTSYDFFDGDDFHTPKNIEKMSNGNPLTDEDRVGWLENINKTIVERYKNAKESIIACSALKESYREILVNELDQNYLFIHLNGNFDLIENRLNSRKEHFMPSNLLKSQFEILQKPKNSLEIDISNSPEKIIEIILQNIKSEFALIGLGVMGKSLARNLASNGFRLSLFNRFLKGSEEQVAIKFINEHNELQLAKGFEDLKEFVKSIERPRKIFLMIEAGKITDIVIDQLSEYLSEGDIIIDGGNSHYKDTENRITYLLEKGIHFIGTGVSGGEKGALTGPSIMPSGDYQAYQLIKPYLEKIAAKDKKGGSCCTYISKTGAGHYVKMVHNGIEYAEMQLLSEVYALLKYDFRLNPEQIFQEFEKWENDGLNSYLLEITKKISVFKNQENYLIDEILDKAGNKGTGNWTTIAASELGKDATLIANALFARYSSASKQERNYISETYKIPHIESNLNLDIEALKNAYELARIVNHHQGFELIKEACVKYEWNMNYSELAGIWTNGCIIRSELMEKISELFKNTDTILKDIEIKSIIETKFTDYKESMIFAMNSKVSTPCLSNGFEFLKTYLFNIPTANMIQAQRDFFGAHTYQRIDDLIPTKHHTIWE